MAKKEEIEKKTEELILPVLAEEGLGLWDVEYLKEASEWYLRVYIDKPSGVTIDDCVSVSRKISDLLDENDYIAEAYTLEVSSPGLGRVLKRERDFENSVGRRVELSFYKADESGNKQYEGVLTSYDKENKTVTVNIEGTDRTLEIKSLAVIRLSFEL
ncbi:MAG: ribosome maturation factor RimP [Lachnospiraceae bacterium]|nr:ribosome maturation factor RimP [Lachnospiraceae bacterium]